MSSQAQKKKSKGKTLEVDSIPGPWKGSFSGKLYLVRLSNSTVYNESREEQITLELSHLRRSRRENWPSLA